MKQHLLLEKAFVYPLPKSQPTLEGYSYDNIKGYWIKNDSRLPYVLDETKAKPRTKKADVETGEDQKGE